MKYEITLIMCIKITNYRTVESWQRYALSECLLSTQVTMDVVSPFMFL